MPAQACARLRCLEGRLLRNSTRSHGTTRAAALGRFDPLSHTAANGRLWRNLPFARTLMKVGRHRFLPSIPPATLQGFARPGKSRHPSKGWRYFPQEVGAADYLFHTPRGEGIRLVRPRWRQGLAGGLSLPGYLRAGLAGRAALPRREERLRRRQRGCAAVGPRMWMSRCCSSVSTAVAGRRAPGAGGKRALCCCDRWRACQRHQASRRDCGA